jgi:hypothetical protein
VVQKVGLVTGTVQAIPSDVPPFVHFVMVEWTDFHSGVEMAIHYTPVVGVACVALDDVITGKLVTVRWTPRTQDEAEAAIHRMQSPIGHPYDLIEANCEHVIRWAVTGEWKSDQVAFIRAGLLVAGAVAIAASL